MPDRRHPHRSRPSSPARLPARPVRRTSILLLAAAAAAVGCQPSDATTSPYLLIAPAANQPTSATFGTLVIAQQSGGSALRLTTQAGTLTLPSADAGAPGAGSACITVAPDQLYYFDVTPSSVECLLYAELLGPSGTGGQPAAGPAQCTGTVLATKVVPITTTRNNTTSSTTTGAGGTDAGGQGTGGQGTGGQGTGGQGTGTGGEPSDAGGG
jgi:hypothetical protein